jgi:hypothetical protein
LAEVQAATPAVASVPVKATATGWLYQPFLFARRPGVAVTAGGVLSILKVRLLLAVEVLSMFEAEHVTVTPFVSAVRVFASQPLEFAAPVTSQLTVTLLVYQPFVPVVPEMTSVISTSAGDPAAPETASRLAPATSSTASRRSDPPPSPSQRLIKTRAVTDPPAFDVGAEVSCVVAVLSIPETPAAPP